MTAARDRRKFLTHMAGTFAGLALTGCGGGKNQTTDPVASAQPASAPIAASGPAPAPPSPPPSSPAPPPSPTTTSSFGSSSAAGLPRKGANLGNAPAYSLTFHNLTPAVLSKFVSTNKIDELRLCFSGGAFLWGSPSYRVDFDAAVRAMFSTGAKVCLAIHSFWDSQVSWNPDVRRGLSTADIISVLSQLAGMYPGVRLDINEPFNWGATASQLFIDNMIAVGKGVRAAHPDAFLYLPCPGWSNDMRQLERPWGTSTVYGWIDAQVHFDAPCVHYYGDIAGMPACVTSTLGLKVNVQEYQPYDILDGSADSKVTADTATQADVDAFMNGLAACKPEAMCAWAYVDEADNTEQVPLGFTTLNAKGQRIESWWAASRGNSSPSPAKALASRALPYLNPVLQAKNGTAALQGAQDYMAYVAGSTLTLDLSDLTEAQKAQQYWVFTGEGGAGIWGYFGDFNANRYDRDYHVEGSADGSTWSLLPVPILPVGLSVLGNTVTGNVDRCTHHVFDLRGFTQVRILFTAGEGFQNGQVTASVAIYDAAGLTTLADWFGIDGFAQFGDSITMLSAIYYQGMSDLIATPEHPAPVWDWVGASGIHAYDWLNDKATFGRKLRQPGKFVVLSLLSNDLSINGAATLASSDAVLDALVAEITAVGKVALINTPPYPNGPAVFDGGAPAKVRQALDDTAVFGKTFGEYLRAKHTGPSSFFLTDLTAFYRANPGQMRPSDLHPADFTGYHAQEASDVKRLVFGVSTPQAQGPAGAPSGGTFLAVDGGSFTLTRATVVWYGVDTRFATRVLQAGSYVALPATFNIADPAFGVVKAAYAMPNGTPITP